MRDHDLGTHPVLELARDFRADHNVEKIVEAAPLFKSQRLPVAIPVVFEVVVRGAHDAVAAVAVAE